MTVLTPAIPLSHQAENPKPTGLNPETALLIDGCLKKDRAAQEQLYKKYYGKMMATCMRYLANRDDAMEVLNLGFLKVYQNLEKYDGNGSFDGWVYRIIRNSIIDHIRSRVKYQQMEGGSTEDLHVTVNETVTENLQAKDLMQLLNVLPQTTRLVFNMFALEGFKHEEIANYLGISAGTTKWHVSEARRVLKIEIEKQGRP